MQPLLCSAVLLLTFSLNAQAPTAVPIPKEPHHHLVLENSYVRVFRVSVPAHESTLLHQHDVPYVYVALGPADVINAVQGKPEAHLTMADGQVGYSPGHFAHIARNEADAPFNNVTIELLRAQGEPRNLCEKVVNGPALKCPTENKDWPADSPLRRLSKLGMIPRRVLETDEIEVSSYSPSLAGSYNQDSHSSRLLVAQAGPRVHVEIEEEAEHSLQNGESVWIEAGKDWRIVLQKEDRPTRFLMIRFKDADAAAKP